MSLGEDFGRQSFSREYEYEDDVFERSLKVLSSLIWAPVISLHVYNIFVTESAIPASTLFTVMFNLAAVPLTWYVTMKKPGEWLMLLAFFSGLVSETFGCPNAMHYEQSNVHRTIRLMGCAIFGLLAGVLCKAKDVYEGRHYPNASIGERLFVVLPFALGECTGIIVRSGVYGIVEVFRIVFFGLATVGYITLSFRMLRSTGIHKADLLVLISKFFTTSFGVVLSVLVIVGTTTIYLAVPFITDLLRLNALMSTIGVAVELFIYDVV